jgi:hypothetical protein
MLETKKKSNAQACGKLALGTLLLYFASYFLLSIAGRYEPEVFGFSRDDGLNHVKWHAWAPRGFPDFTNIRKFSWQWVYVPLWLLDCRVWHSRAEEPGYRRNKWDRTANPAQWRVITNPE